MNKFYLFFTYIFGIFTKPKKELKVSPIVRPCATDKNMKLYEVVESFTVEHLYVPKNTKTDGASIPSLFWQIIGHPFSPPFVAYAIGHDYLYQRAIKVYKKDYKEAMHDFMIADRWLYGAMRQQNRKIVAWLFFISVRAYSLVKFGIFKRVFR